jgi:hypothetical protein
MAKPKINMSAVKEFMFNHGEKVALGVCGFIAIVLGGLKLMGAAGAGIADGTNKPWPAALTDAKNSIQSQMANAKIQPVDMSALKPEPYGWPKRESNFVPTPYTQVGEVNDSKRRNPTALKMLEDPKSFRLDYIRALVHVHDYDKAERTVKGIAPAGAGAVAPPPPLPGTKKKGEVAAPAFVPDRLKAAQAQRFVVVQGIFPLKQQVEEFRKALKLATQKELFDLPREDLPKFLGLNVVRFELTKIGGEMVGKEPEVIVQFDPRANSGKGGLKLQKALETLLREAMYDEDTPEALKAYLYDGLAMPLPKLAYGRYPKFKFTGWDIAWAEDEPAKKDIAMEKQPPQTPKGGGPKLPGGSKGKLPNPNPMPPPGMNPGGGVERVVETIFDKDLREAEPILSGRLFGNFKKINDKEKNIVNDFNVFHVLGELAPTEDRPLVIRPPGKGPRPAGTGPAMPNPNPNMKPNQNQNQNQGSYFDAWDIDPPEAPTAVPGPTVGTKPPKDAPPASYPPWERDALVRFIDADVQPGKTYSYAIQVRIANPNYKQVNLVAAEFLATVPELQDNNNSWVTTPSITIPQDYFLYAMDQTLFDEAASPPTKKEIKLPPKDTTTFQVHRWMTQAMDMEKGEPYIIGDWVVVERQVVRKGEHIGGTLTVPVVVWNKMKEAFEVPKTPATKKDPEKWARIKIKDDAPILVDFTGGRRLKEKTAFLEEDTAVEALIMTADGKLRVHNSRDDAEAKQAEAKVEGQLLQEVSRQQRWLTAQRRIQEVKRAAAPPADPKMPGPGKN